MRAWEADGLPTAKRRDAILLATRAHDDGWTKEDRLPIVDPASGRLLDFIHADESLTELVPKEYWQRRVR